MLCTQSKRPILCTTFAASTFLSVCLTVCSSPRSATSKIKQVSIWPALSVQPRGPSDRSPQGQYELCACRVLASICDTCCVRARRCDTFAGVHRLPEEVRWFAWAKQSAFGIIFSAIVVVFGHFRRIIRTTTQKSRIIFGLFFFLRQTSGPVCLAHRRTFRGNAKGPLVLLGRKKSASDSIELIGRRRRRRRQTQTLIVASRCRQEPTGRLVEPPAEFDIMRQLKCAER